MRQSVTIPAVLKTPGNISLYPPVNAQLVDNRMQENRMVQNGQVLARFASPDLDEQLLKTKRELALLKARLDRSSADNEELSLRNILLAQHGAKMAELKGLHKQLEQLTVLAPASGRLVNVDPLVTSGIWVNPGFKLALIKTSNTPELTGMADEEGARNILDGTVGIFIADNPRLPALQAKLVELFGISLKSMEEPLLADINGGSVETVMAEDEQTGGQSLKPRATWYKARLEIADPAKIDLYPDDQIIRGMVHLKGKSQNYAGRIGRHLASVLFRELSP